MNITCNHCDRSINTKGLSAHLTKLHDISFDEYVKKNRIQFPQIIDCPICNTMTYGSTCSVKCRSIMQSIKQIGRQGWSKGLTKDTHSGLKRMAEKASLRKGVNIWDRMSAETKIVAKQKMSIKAKINNAGNNNPMFGKTHSPESIQKIFKYRKISSLEQKLIDFFDKNGIQYHFQFFIGDTDKYAYDFKIKNKNIIIELDGDYWHGGPGCKKYHDDVENTKTRDTLKQEYAIQKGFKILRFWESDIKKNQLKIFNSILTEIEK